jgi:imidazoleglycerol-phosphate dehydratase
VADPRRAAVDRQTRETKIHLELTIDGSGKAELSTGVPFFDHMLDAVARHGLFDLVVRVDGDLEVEAHHTIEDVGIERRGITRMAHAYAPLDEALGFVVIDCGGRGYAVVDAPLAGEIVGGVDADMFRHFVESFAIEGRLNVHARIEAGVNAHHKVEALFKALGRALDAATRIDPRLGDAVPSTKGSL